jgi:hypothetical protein
MQKAIETVWRIELRQRIGGLVRIVYDIGLAGAHWGPGTT